MTDCTQLPTSTHSQIGSRTSCHMTHSSDELIVLFNQCFKHTHSTELVKGNDEPLYQPKSTYNNYHQVIFAHGFFSSALHEIAHWCIAGPQRRLRVDYGYWYQPDGRDQYQQNAFEQVESKPQALEWIFSKATGIRFFISADNLSGPSLNTTTFKQTIYQETLNYLDKGLPHRAQQFTDQLIQHYQPGLRLTSDHFAFTELI